MIRKIHNKNVCTKKTKKWGSVGDVLQICFIPTSRTLSRHCFRLCLMQNFQTLFQGENHPGGPVTASIFSNVCSHRLPAELSDPGPINSGIARFFHILARFLWLTAWLFQNPKEAPRRSSRNIAAPGNSLCKRAKQKRKPSVCSWPALADTGQRELSPQSMLGVGRARSNRKEEDVKSHGQKPPLHQLPPPQTVPENRKQPPTPGATQDGCPL